MSESKRLNLNFSKIWWLFFLLFVYPNQSKIKKVIFRTQRALYNTYSSKIISMIFRALGAIIRLFICTSRNKKNLQKVHQRFLGTRIPIFTFLQDLSSLNRIVLISFFENRKILSCFGTRKKLVAQKNNTLKNLVLVSSEE